MESCAFVAMGDLHVLFHFNVTCILHYMVIAASFSNVIRLGGQEMFEITGWSSRFFSSSALLWMWVVKWVCFVFNHAMFSVTVLLSFGCFTRTWLMNCGITRENVTRITTGSTNEELLKQQSQVFNGRCCLSQFLRSWRRSIRRSRAVPKQSISELGRSSMAAAPFRSKHKVSNWSSKLQTPVW